MKRNTEHYQSDFDIDKNIIRRAVESSRKEDKTLLWMSRPMGTHCHPEYEAFIQDTAAYNTWRFYAEQTNDPIVACAVELTGVEKGIVRGNVYELDYHTLAADISRKAVPVKEVEKTFEDGFVDRVSLDRSSYGYFVGLVEQHGPIVASKTIPENEKDLEFVLAEQKQIRDRMKETTRRPSLSEKIVSASVRANGAADRSELTGHEGPAGR